MAPIWGNCISLIRSSAATNVLITPELVAKPDKMKRRGWKSPGWRQLAFNNPPKPQMADEGEKLAGNKATGGRVGGNKATGGRVGGN